MPKRHGSDVSPQASKKQATLTSFTKVVETVPVVKPVVTSQGTSPSSAAGSDGKFARPSLPTEKESIHCDVEALMKDVCRWCEQELPAAIDMCPGLTGMCQKRPFWECRPLAIREAGKGSLVGHRRACTKRA